jgi:hypothetical protein
VTLREKLPFGISANFESRREKNMTRTVHYHLHTCILLLVLAAAGSVAGRAQSVQGTISGVAQTPDGKPLASATVFAIIMSSPPRPLGQNSALPVLSTLSKNDGSFTISNVPPGSYRICARHIGLAFLDPCTWGTAPSVVVGNGNWDWPGQNVQTILGAKLHVHVDDLSGYLAKNVGKAAGAGLAMGVVSPQGFFPLAISDASANSRDYELLVPVNVTHNLRIMTTYFKLTNQANAPVDATQTTPVLLTSTQPAAITFHITGTL